MFVQLKIFPACIVPRPNEDYECWDEHGQYLGEFTFTDDATWHSWNYELDEAEERDDVAYWAKIPEFLFGGA